MNKQIGPPLCGRPILHVNGHFYATDVKIVKTNLTSETLIKAVRYKTGRKKEDGLSKENEIFL